MDNDFNSIVKKYLSKGKAPIISSQSDNDVPSSLKEQIRKRDKGYSELLQDHIRITRRRAFFKELHKWVFFWLIIVSCIVGMVSIQRIFKRVLSEEDINIVIQGIPLIITALVSLVSTIIVVPVTVSKYLFNTNEDDNITDLIKHTQEHDHSNIGLLKEELTNSETPSSKKSFRTNKKGS